VKVSKRGPRKKGKGAPEGGLKKRIERFGGNEKGSTLDRRGGSRIKHRVGKTLGGPEKINNFYIPFGWFEREKGAEGGWGGPDLLRGRRGRTKRGRGGQKLRKKTYN